MRPRSSTTSTTTSGDDYGSVVAAELRATLADLQRTCDRGIMVFLEDSASGQVALPILLERGFQFFRARGEAASLRWFNARGSIAAAHGGDPVPAAAHTSMAVSAVVLSDDSRHVLLIKQTYDPSREWRLPGGALDPHESLLQCSEREVKEETGEDVCAEVILGLRHAPRYNTPFGEGFLGACALCRLRSPAPASTASSLAPAPSTACYPAAQRGPDDEIIDAQWIPVEVALRPPGTHDLAMGGSEFQRECLRRAIATRRSGSGAVLEVDSHTSGFPSAIGVLPWDGLWPVCVPPDSGRPG